MMRIRRLHFVLLHRYVGLLIALFLVIASVTGGLLAFKDELDAWLAPQLFVAASTPDAPLLDPFDLRQKVAQQVAPKGRVDAVVFNLKAGYTARFPIAPNPDPETGKFYELDYDEVFVDPHTGQIQGRRARDAISLRPGQLMPLVFQIHHSLALPGVWGTLLLGVVSLLWTLDCFVGAYLTLPKGRPWMPKWKQAWLIKWHAGVYRATLDVHRAGGLWLWAVLLLFAWSSVMFNLREPVFRPVMGIVFPFDDSWRSVPVRPKPVLSPALGWREAHLAAQVAMQDMGRSVGFRVDHEERLMLDRRRGVYAYMVHSSVDLRDTVGNTALLIDADTGAPRGHWLPTGGASGNTVSNWMGALHMAHVFGLPYRIFVALLGVAVSVLSVTGFMIWWKKCHARAHAKTTSEFKPLRDEPV
ncbi:PepSY-associated TM helix domain-containing protein [Leptospira sp. 96542]|nr:PepSY-associated TM helix domain-containing protein [Leptospira sp. 96542]